jgi:protein-S-isoprenylcysteine O-methyltransferase Ste14
MYSGALVMFLGTPLALGSWWGMLTLIPFSMIIIWRLLGEEKFLSENLPGYKEYCQKVRYRLIPLLW